jgi:HTH-type transcriptional regulator/antitoxin HigA
MNQSDTTNFRPDYAVHPGLLLEQELEHHELSQAEFARRIARTPKLVSEIISGKNPIEPETAIQFEHVLGIGADVWLRIEADYRLHQARLAEAERLAASEAWLKAFPVKELSEWGAIRRTGSTAQQAHDLLALFGVASPAAFQQRYASLSVHYRKSKKLRASREALLTWLRYGEIIAASEQVEEYNKDRFRKALLKIKELTNERIEEFRPKLKSLCAESGVVFVLIPSLPKTCLSGAAYWARGKTPIIQQSLRHKTNDHFWFTFFHEAGHILLHNSKTVYADDENGTGDGTEKEANDFATELLVGKKRLREFILKGQITRQEVTKFANDCGIHPGIIVGMLQHHGTVPWAQLNFLKAKFDWAK